MKVVTIFVNFLLIASVLSAEVSYSVNVKNIINEISENFVSFEVKFDELVEMSRQGKSFKFLNQISPSYIKISNFSQHLTEQKKENVNKSVVAELIRTLK